MERVKIEGKEYIAGLKWFSFDNKEDALEKKKEIGNADIIKVSDNLYLVYEKPKERGIILASGFLHLASGYYYITLDDGRKWILLKGTDGGILYEGAVKEFKDAEERYHDLFLGFYDSSGRIRREEIFISDGKKFKHNGNTQKQVYYIVAGFFTFVIVVIAMLTLKKPKNNMNNINVATPEQVNIQQPINNSSKTEKPKPDFNFGTLNVNACFEEFYKTGKCEINVSEKNRTEPQLTCEEVLNKIYSVAKKYPASALTWGENKSYEDFYLYSFSISGNFLKKDISFIEKIDFVDGQMIISGGILNPNITISGVLGCK